MPSFDHQALIELFRNRPSLAVDLLKPRLSLPEGPIQTEETELGDILPSERRSDLALKLGTLGIILEVQLKEDPQKLLSWPAYLANWRSRKGGVVLLLVVTLSSRVERWAKKPIVLGPGFTLEAHVVGPASIPLMVDAARIEQDPELGVLSAMVHGRGPHGVAIAEATFPTLRKLDEDRGKLYTDLVLSHLGPLAREVLEALMLQNYEYQSAFARKYMRQGRKEGKMEGEQLAAHHHLEELRALLLQLLRARNLPISEDRIQGCTDKNRLQQWILLAGTASEDIFRD